MECTNIYFIGSVELGAVKIGKSYNPDKRLAELQTGNSHELILYGIIKDVKEDYEMKIHQIFDHIRLKGEWFKLTDELIHFMINKTNETNYFKNDTPNLLKVKVDPLNEIVDNIVEYDETGREFLKESDLVDVIRRYFIFIGISTHFDIKKVRRIMESKGIYRTRENGDWGYPGHRANEKKVYPDHYIRSASTLRSYVINEWNNAWKQWIHEHSTEWKDIKFTPGYSIINTEDRDKQNPIRINFIKTTLHGNENKVVIYKGGIYNTCCKNEE